MFSKFSTQRHIIEVAIVILIAAIVVIVSASNLYKENRKAIDLCGDVKLEDLKMERRVKVSEYIVIGSFQASTVEDMTRPTHYLLGVLDHNTKAIKFYVPISLGNIKDFTSRSEVKSLRTTNIAAIGTSTLEIDGYLGGCGDLAKTNLQTLLRSCGLSDAEIEGKLLKFGISDITLGGESRGVSSSIFTLIIATIVLIVFGVLEVMLMKERRYNSWVPEN